MTYLYIDTRAYINICIHTVGFRHIETGRYKLQTGFGQFLPLCFRNTLAGIWGSFLRFIATAFLGLERQ